MSSRSAARAGIGDYPKLGIWPDAYYIAINMFNPSFIGMGAYAFDRTAMLAGDAAGSIVFQPFRRRRSAVGHGRLDSSARRFAELLHDLVGQRPGHAQYL